MQKEISYGNGAFSVLKAVLLALGVSLLATVVFAVILRAAALREGVIYPVTQTIKCLALAIGVLTFVRGDKGWLKGGAVGLLFTALSYLAFSALGGDFSLTWLIFLELAISLSIGVVSGMLAVNLRT